MSVVLAVAGGLAAAGAIAVVTTWGAAPTLSEVLIGACAVVVTLGLAVAASTAAMTIPRTGAVASVWVSVAGLAFAGCALAMGGSAHPARLTVGVLLVAHALVLLHLLRRPDVRIWLAHRRSGTARGAEGEPCDLAHVPWF
ncbi:hypothetical protein ACIOBK_33650 [Micromonospora chokoriensis]